MNRPCVCTAGQNRLRLDACNDAARMQTLVVTVAPQRIGANGTSGAALCLALPPAGRSTSQIPYIGGGIPDNQMSCKVPR